jgi:hypothetical protein
MGLGAAQEEIPTGRADDYRKGLEESADRLLSPRARSDLTDEGLTDPEDYVRNRKTTSGTGFGSSATTCLRSSIMRV